MSNCNHLECAHLAYGCSRTCKCKIVTTAGTLTSEVIKFCDLHASVEKLESSLAQAKDEIEKLNALLAKDHQYKLSLLAERDRLSAQNAKLREFIESEAGFDCDNSNKYLGIPSCGACSSCRARKALSNGKETAG